MSATTSLVLAAVAVISVLVILAAVVFALARSSRA